MPSWVRTALLLVFGAFVLYVKLASTSSPPPSSASPASSIPAGASTTLSSAEAASGIPQKAIDVLQTVRTTGEAPEGYVGGRVFENREGRLPADGDYREFDVDPHHGQRNAERLIVEWKTKKAWYTGDHYQTFTPVP